MPTHLNEQVLQTPTVCESIAEHPQQSVVTYVLVASSTPGVVAINVLSHGVLPQNPFLFLAFQHLLLPTMGRDWVTPDKLDDGVIERHQPFGLSVLRPPFF
ncbi:hypothetical protein WJX77_000876 [Trebouxia sp. C0004]